MSDVLMDLHNHYKAVRARLNAGPPPKPQPAPEPTPAALPEPSVEPVDTPPLTALAANPEIIRGLRSTAEVKEKILPILEKHKIGWNEASGKSQQWKYTKCRFEIYVKLYAHGWSLSQIGRLCGNRDHTTVLNGIKKFIKENFSEEEIEVCLAAGMRPVDYWEGKTLLREMRDE